MPNNQPIKTAVNAKKEQPEAPQQPEAQPLDRSEALAARIEARLTVGHYESKKASAALYYAESSGQYTLEYRIREPKPVPPRTAATADKRVPKKEAVAEGNDDQLDEDLTAEDLARLQGNAPIHVGRTANRNTSRPPTQPIVQSPPPAATPEGEAIAPLLTGPAEHATIGGWHWPPGLPNGAPCIDSQARVLCWHHT